MPTRDAWVVFEVLARLAAEHVGEVKVLVVEQGAAALDRDVRRAVGGDRRHPDVVTTGQQVVQLFGDRSHSPPPSHTLSFVLSRDTQLV